MAAMLVHTAGESYKPPPKSRDPTYAVALKATQEQLLELEQVLFRKGIDHVAFREPDEPYNNELMGIGACGNKETLYQYFRRYSLI